MYHPQVSLLVTVAPPKEVAGKSTATMSQKNPITREESPSHRQSSYNPEHEIAKIGREGFKLLEELQKPHKVRKVGSQNVGEDGNNNKWNYQPYFYGRCPAAIKRVDPSRHDIILVNSTAKLYEEENVIKKERFPKAFCLGFN